MQVRWLRQSDAQDLIVVFGGWALGASPFAHLTTDSDVLLVDDYRDLDCELPDLSGYETRTLVAFSFGVAAYAHWQQGRADTFTRKIAVNGTLTPVDRKVGIPPTTMKRTIDTLSEASFQQFLNHCYNAAQPFSRLNVGDRKAELLAVQARGAAPEILFNLAWISEQDRIFPADNQTRGWAVQAEDIRWIETPHVPFGEWESWDEVIA